MKVLVACEFSGRIREAFASRGHNAWSCDLLPTEIIGNHIHGDVLEIINNGWDLMICHPPCDHLAVSGARYFAQKRQDGRQQRAIDFFMNLVSADIPRIAVENPISIMSTVYRKPDQIIQPWMFGVPESKSTCLWLKNLPLLIPTNILQKPLSGRWLNQTPTGQNKLGESKHRWMDRSRTYIPIAEAMAEQWS